MPFLGEFTGTHNETSALADAETTESGGQRACSHYPRQRTKPLLEP